MSDEEIKVMKPKDSLRRLPKQPDCVRRSPFLEPLPFRLLVSGASGSGKSNLISNLLGREIYYKKAFQGGILVISPTATEISPGIQLDDTYTSHLGDNVVFVPPENGAEAITRVFQIQEEQMRRRKTKGAKHTLILLDDCVSHQKALLKTPICKRLATMGRHFRISAIFATQSFHLIPKNIRLQCSVIYFLGSGIESQFLADEFCIPGMTRKEFLSLINSKLSNRYSFLCIFCQFGSDISKKYRLGLKHPFVSKRIAPLDDRHESSDGSDTDMSYKVSNTTWQSHPVEQDNRTLSGTIRAKRKRKSSPKHQEMY